jgi:polyhydroxybutyrate depolymerase
MNPEIDQLAKQIETSTKPGGDLNRVSQEVSSAIFNGRSSQSADKMMTEVTNELFNKGAMPAVVRAFATANFNDLDLDGNGTISQQELQKIDEQRFFNRSLSAMDHQLVKYMRTNFSEIAKAKNDWGLDTEITRDDLSAHDKASTAQLRKSGTARSIEAVFGNPEIFNRIDRDKDGYLSEKEIKTAIASPATSVRERDLLQFMKDNRSEIAKISNDERLWESKISRKDISGFAAKNGVNSGTLKPGPASNYYSLPAVERLNGNRFGSDVMVDFGKKNLKALDVDNSGYLTRPELERLLNSPRWGQKLDVNERKAMEEMSKSLELIQRSHKDELWYKDRKGVTEKDLDAYKRDQEANRADLPTKPGDHNLSLTIGGVKRDFQVHIPPGYDGSKAVPALYFYHYFTGNPTELANYTGMNAIADRENFIVVYPQAEGWVGDKVRQWNLNNNPNYRVDEVAFSQILMNTVESKLNVDKNRTYIAGYSNGGMLAHELAARFSDRIAAMASVSGCQNPGQPAAAESVNALIIHGTKDRLVPVQGRSFTPLFPKMKPLESGREFWCTTNGTDKFSTKSLTENATCDTYTNSKTGKEVSVMTLKGSGHGWPGSNHSVDGNPSKGVNASEEIWKFLSRHSRDEKPPASYDLGLKVVQR